MLSQANSNAWYILIQNIFIHCFRYDVNANGDKFSKFDDIVSQIIEDDSSFYAFNQNLKNLNISFNQGSNG